MTKHRDFVVCRYPKHAPQELPPGAWSLARNRTEHLGAKSMELPMRDLLAHAWCQGIADAGQVIDRIHPQVCPSIGLV